MWGFRIFQVKFDLGFGHSFEEPEGILGQSLLSAHPSRWMQCTHAPCRDERSLALVQLHIPSRKTNDIFVYWLREQLGTIDLPQVAAEAPIVTQQLSVFFSICFLPLRKVNALTQGIAKKDDRAGQ